MVSGSKISSLNTNSDTSSNFNSEAVPPAHIFRLLSQAPASSTEEPAAGTGGMGKQGVGSHTGTPDSFLSRGEDPCGQKASLTLIITALLLLCLRDCR